MFVCSVQTNVALITTPAPLGNDIEQNPAIEGGTVEQEDDRTIPNEEAYEDYDDSWFLVKAKEELKRRQKRPELKDRVGGDEDAVQVCHLLL